jgi:hypothetical protein
MYTVTIQFTWGTRTFSFPFLYEAENFRSASLLCRECILAETVKLPLDPTIKS